MTGHRLVSLACCLFLVFTVLSHRACAQDSSSAQASGSEEYTVTVLSPTEVPLADVGKLHKKSVEVAFQLPESNRLNVEGHSVRFRFRSTGNPVENSATCAEEARRAVHEKRTIAILGPVASNCTEHVLRENSKVPVISSLSTAKDLGRESKWFFRTIDHDEQRLKTFIDTAKHHDLGVQNSISIYTDSDYGRGLHKHLLNLVGDGRATGIDSTHTFQWDNIVRWQEEPAHMRVLTDDFRHEMRHHHALDNVFVLGSNQGTASITQQLDCMFRKMGSDPNFVVVGSTRSENKLPADTWLIGEAQVRTSPNLVASISEQNPPKDLYISTLDAGIALKRAIRNVLRDSESNRLSEIRSTLREELSRKSLPSSERGRPISFQSDGEVREPPTTPIYRTSGTRRLVNPESPAPWVEIRVLETPKGHLEGPVVVELTPHGEDLRQDRIDLQVEGIDTGGSGDTTITVKENVRLNRPDTVSFTPLFLRAGGFPNTFWISTDTPNMEREKIGRLGWSSSYPLAALLALIGALLYTRYRRRRDGETEVSGPNTGTLRSIGSWTLWSLQRCMAGLVIAFLILHVAPILKTTGPLSWIPIPRFGSSGEVNAVVAGLLGGWLGLNPIVGLAASVTGTLTPLFQS